MKKLLLSALLLGPLAAFAQSPIVINQNDMPDVGDTLRVSVGVLNPALNVQATGANHTWDFSNLQPASQRVENFVSVTSTGSTYQLFFNNQLFFPNAFSSIASSVQLPAQMAGMGITDPYGFYRETATQFKQTGWGGTLNGSAVPITFNNPDIIYSFPMNYQDQNTSDSDYEASAPGTGYIAHEQTRANVVDGWGTLTTPFGTFQTLRQVSTINATDTIFMNGQGIRIVQPITREYRWLAKNTGSPKLGIPVLQITTQEVQGLEVISNIVYRDQYRNMGPTAAADIIAGQPVSVYPNPFTSELSIGLPAGLQGDAVVSLYDAQGRLVKTANANGPFVWNSAELNISSGMYFLHIQHETGTIVKKLVSAKL